MVKICFISLPRKFGCDFKLKYENSVLTKCKQDRYLQTSKFYNEFLTNPLMPIFIKPRKRLNRMVKYLEDRPREKILGVAYFVVGENGLQQVGENETQEK